MLVQCSCGKKLNLKDSWAGKKVRCPGCQEVFVVEAEGEADEEAAEPKPKTSRSNITAAPQPGQKGRKAPKAEEEEDEDDRSEDEDEERESKPKTSRSQIAARPPPRQKGRQAPKAEEEEDEDDRDEDEDDEDDERESKRSAGKKRKQAPVKKGVPIWRNIAGGVLLLVLLGVAGFVYWSKLSKGGTLQLSISSPSAEVLLDGKPTTYEKQPGAEGVELNIDVRPGDHELKVNQAGFEPYIKRFTMQSGETEKIFVRLVPSKGPGPLPRPK